MNERKPVDQPKDASIERRFSPTEFKDQKFTAGKMTLAMTETAGDTIQRVLSSYDLGKKLRQLRMRKKIALTHLGKHTGLSASMLSQLENGKLIPTLPTLARIAMVFDVGMEHFFQTKKRRSVFSIVRSNERIRFPDRPDAVKPAFYFECLAFSTQDKGVQAYVAQFPKREKGEVTEHFHDGSELVHVLEGSLALLYDGDEHVLKPGDSVYFDSSEPHWYRGLSKAPAKAIVITTPPRA
jgi:quercetin dioxygenase-like cupin family protein/DNA-binding XRE family transcriptional regulator